jgi:hypothetical protein
MLTTSRRIMALAVAFLLVAAATGLLGVHSHTDNDAQTCTRCQALPLPGSLASDPALSRPVPQAAVVAPSETQRIFHALSPSLSYRGPPSRPATA